MREGLTTSPLLEEARHLLRERVPHYTQDRYFAPDIDNAIALLAARHLTRLLPAVLPACINHRCSLYPRRGSHSPTALSHICRHIKKSGHLYMQQQHKPSAARAQCPTHSVYCARLRYRHRAVLWLGLSHQSGGPGGAAGLSDWRRGGVYRHARAGRDGGAQPGFRLLRQLCPPVSRAAGRVYYRLDLYL